MKLFFKSYLFWSYVLSLKVLRQNNRGFISNYLLKLGCDLFRGSYPRGKFYHLKIPEMNFRPFGFKA